MNIREALIALYEMGKDHEYHKSKPAGLLKLDKDSGFHLEIEQTALALIDILEEEFNYVRFKIW